MRWPWKREETELDMELGYHVETLADAFEKQGMSRTEAMRKARKEFGGVDTIKDQCRDESRWNWLAQAGQDVRFGWRMMRKTPSITLAAIATLALGIGATTAILALADAVLWRTLPLPAPEQLTELFWTAKGRADGLVRGSSGSNFPDNGVQVADYFSFQGYRNMRERAAGKAQLAAHMGDTQVSASFAGQVSVSKLRPVSGNFFQTLQVQPFAGRLFTGRDDDAGAPFVIVTTHRFWENQLGADPAAVGKSILMNNRAYTIAGVLARGFTGIVPGDATDLYVTIWQSPEMLIADSFYRKAVNNPLNWVIQLMARRNAGVSQTELDAMLTPAFAASWAAPPKSPEQTPRLRLQDASHGLGALRRRFGDPVWTLLGLVTLVLLISCANIANLLLARAVEREKEAALRVSLGCGNGRLMRQFFTESLLLAMIGGVMGVGVAALLGRLMSTLLPRGADGLTLTVESDPRALLGTAAVALLAALLFGLYPAWRTARVDASPALKEGSGSAGTMSRSRWAPAKLLVLFQVALGVLLVTAAILYTGRLSYMVGKEAGFERGHALLFDIRPGEIGYRDERLRQFYFTLEERLASLAGVESVGLARTRPMRGGGYWDDVTKVGETKGVGSAIHHINPAFIGALGVPIVAGRSMTVQEARSGAKVAVISEDMAQKFGESPLGLHVKVSGDDYEVIGVARQARYSDLERPTPVAYLPFDYKRDSVTVLLRTTVPPLTAYGMVRNAMRDLDRDLPLVDVFTMEQQISKTLQRERLFAWLCGSFGVLALVLCAVGLYGLMSHTTARRTPEIGIRMALGASRGDVLSQVLWEGLRLAVAGLVLGVPLALYAADFAVKQRVLPEGPMPYWTLVAAISALAAAAFMAVLAPAMRASAVDPMQALRQG
ncbi:MAG: ABC transporter permease [Acidobacteria bacterium]|nr:ABC transporter permease [Acidobacteriota bacterium]